MHQVLPHSGGFLVGHRNLRRAGAIRVPALERKGCTIGVNDLHIAAHARSEGLALVSNNVRDFERVEAPRLEDWSF